MRKRKSGHVWRKVFPCVYIVVARNAGNGRGVFTAALTVAVFRASENKFLRSYNRTVKWQRFIRNDYAPVVYQRVYTHHACICVCAPLSCPLARQTERPASRFSPPSPRGFATTWFTVDHRGSIGSRFTVFPSRNDRSYIANEGIDARIMPRTRGTRLF